MPQDEKELFAGIEITPQEVKQQMDAGKNIFLVDVREAWENQTAAIKGAKLIPLGDVPASLAAFEAAEDDTDGIIIFCHRGQRSLDAAAWLRTRGVPGAKSMTGGIARWSNEIDPSVPHY